jgi:protein involved in polysaccharide export with SLBB domain
MVHDMSGWRRYLRARTLGALLLLAAVPLAAQTAGGGGTLRSGDGIRLRVLGMTGDAALSGEFTVDERLVVVLPKLGEWSVDGVPADSIRPRVLRALSEYLVTPSIEVTPYRRIAITGEVVRPGLYPIDAGMSVGEAIILASGAKPSAREGVVEVRRLGARSGVEVPLEARVWAVELGAGDQLVVPTRSWVRRNGMAVVTTTLSIATSLSFILWRVNR